MNSAILRIAIISGLMLCSLFCVSCGDDGEKGPIDTGGNDNSTTDSDTIATGGCGDGVINGDEICDGPVDCSTQGRYHIGQLATCNADCTAYDLSKCVARDPGDLCGNGIVEPSENYEICEIGDTTPCTEVNPNFREGDLATCADNCRTWDTYDCLLAGTDTCSQIYNCVAECGDITCETDCLDAGSDDGKARYEALMTCFSSNCASGADVKECTETACPTEYFSCFPSEKCGNGTIDEGEVCEKGESKDCGELDPEKYKPGKEALCNSICTGFDVYMCIDINALTCYEVYACIGECAGDTTCEDACKAQSYADANTRLDTMLTCYEEECANTDNGCYAEKCEFQTDACKTHATCGDKVIDQYEICESGDKKDCGEVDPDKYESGTANAFCNVNCTRWSTTGCFGFCSCGEVKLCVDQCPGGQATTDGECVTACKALGSQAGKGEYNAWRTFILSCCDQGGTKCGFDNQDCIDQATKDYPCAVNDQPKCEY